jgi:hypothetical protein
MSRPLCRLSDAGASQSWAEIAVEYATGRRGWVAQSSVDHCTEMRLCESGKALGQLSAGMSVGGGVCVASLPGTVRFCFLFPETG